MSSFSEEMFMCPITHERIITAVSDHEGNTYEKTAIEKWLSKNQTSPLTRNPLTMSNLSPNRALQSVIDSMVAEEGDAAMSLISLSNEPTTVSATMTEGHSSTDHFATVVVKVKVGAGTRTPLDVALCLDNSGSMDGVTTFTSEDGVVETSNLTKLDVVKHGAKTVIMSLGPDDKVSLVKYSSSATVLCPLTRCDAGGKALLLAALDAIDTEGSTNIWDGLHKSLEELRKCADNGRIPYVMLMTDGCPNINPPRGHVSMLERYFDSHKDFSCVVNTYGFGENLDSELLDAISEKMHGSYCYIPDSGFVGTIFVNSIAHMKTIALTNAGLNVEFDENYFEAYDCDNYDINRFDASNFSHLKIGNVSSDQERSFCFKFKTKQIGKYTPAPSVTLHGLDRGLKKGVVVNGGVCERVDSWPIDFYRHCLVGIITEGIQGSTMNNLNDLHSRLQQNFGDSEYAQALMKDIKGQITLGLSDKYLHKWGKHFLRSLARSHKNQQCLNFKDPGVQFYGGDVFNAYRDEADDIFNSLPGRVPKKKWDGRDDNDLYTAPTTMLSYNYGGGGCFDGEGMVLMAEPWEKLRWQIPVKRLKKGDVIMSKYRVFDTTIERPKKVACIVRTKIDDTVDMVDINGVLLTPWHPIFHNGDWKFPAKIGAETRHNIGYIYNVVLEDHGHSIFINDVECITLGHGLTHHDVVDHDYFGEKVVTDLKCSDGWENGLVEINQGDWTRGEDGRVNGLGEHIIN